MRSIIWRISVIIIGLLLIGAVRAGFFFILIDRTVVLDRIYAIPQSTIILDRNNKELFRFFEEDRARVGFDQISPYMLDAIVAVEDQTFWENNGTDAKSLLRAVRKNMEAWYEGSSQLQGGSTITQQVVKNVYLTNIKTIQRKVKEIFLARRLTQKWKNIIQDQEGRGSDEAFIATKQNILSAYLNIVFFGNQSYGIESAARQYFQTTPDNLSLLQSAILASLPQAPTLYNPVRDPAMVLGYWRYEQTIGVGDSEFYESEFEEIIDENDYGEGVQFDTDYGSDGVIDSRLFQSQYAGFVYEQLRERGGFDVQSGGATAHCLESLRLWATVTVEGVPYEYIHGRKDRVLCRMLELGFINQQQFIEAFLDAEQTTVHTARFLIKAPHFVWRVHDYFLSLPEVRASGLTDQQIIQNGYTIRTTLDLDMQLIAEESLLNYKSMLRNLGGNNRAFTHIDARTGAVRSYVGSENFYDDQIDGQVDVLQAIRQVGSTLKPFVYAYLFTNYPYTKHGAVVDFPIPGTSPRNHDSLFWGKTTVENALAGSRNLPAVRTFIAMGGARVFVPYFQSLGFTRLRDDKHYSYPIVLGADEATLLQLGQAYTQLAITGQSYPLLTPIERIVDNQGGVIYENPGAVHKKIIPDTVGEMIWSILSDPSAMPTKRKWLHNHPLDHIALKTGTSDIKVGRRVYPRDALSVIYTPNDVFVSRAGNTDGSAMGAKAFGGEVNHYPMKQYLQGLVDNNFVVDQPRVSTTTFYTPEGFYAGATNNSLTIDQQQWLWRGGR